MKFYVIGDIHGMYDQFKHLVEKIKSLIKIDIEKNIPYTLVFTGDYVDRGPKSKEVLDELIKLKNELKDNVVLLRGNHEVALMGLFSCDDWKRYYTFGAYQTVKSFNFDDKLLFFYQNWLIDNTKYLHVHENLIFVHAGLPVGMKEDEYYELIRNPKNDDIIWIREPFLGLYMKGNVPSFMKDKIVIHGHTMEISDSVNVYKNRICVDKGSYHTGRIGSIIIDNSTVTDISVKGDNNKNWYHETLKAFSHD